MYCRKCGNKLSDKAQFCDKCGEKTVMLHHDSTNVSFAKMAAEDAERLRKLEKRKSNWQKRVSQLKNVWVLPALVVSIVAFVVSWLPFGSHMWFKIGVLVLAIIADILVYMAVRVNQKYQKEYRYKVKEKQVNVAKALAIITTFIAASALFMSIE